MKKQILSMTALAALGLFATRGATAQDFVMYGKVEDVQGTANQWFLDCTDVQLRSNSINLAPFHRQFVKIRGRAVAGTLPTVEVNAIEAFAQVINLGGNRRPGSQFEIDVFGAQGNLFAVFVATGNGFLPLGDLGTWFLDVTATYVGGGVRGTSGQNQIIIPIPNDPRLVGLEVWAQGAAMQPGMAPFLTNVDCKEIRS